MTTLNSMRVSFYLVRHGSTAANNPNAERIRGWKPWSLSDKGIIQAKQAGYFLGGKGITRVWHSPLKRVKQTAEYVNGTLRLPKEKVEEHGSLLDWNTGAMEGMYVEPMKPFLDFYQRHPSLLVPEGESYQEFWDRWKKMFKDMVDFAVKNPEEKLVGITHARNLVTLQHWLKKRPIGPVSYDDVPRPGSVVEVTVDNGRISMKVVHGKEGTDHGP